MRSRGFQSLKFGKFMTCCTVVRASNCVLLYRLKRLAEQNAIIYLFIYMTQWAV